MICWVLAGAFLVSSWLFVWAANDRIREKRAAERGLIRDLVHLSAALHRRRVLTPDECRMLGWVLEQSER